MLFVGLALSAITVLPGALGADGQVHGLVKDARGLPIAVVFVSRDCPICGVYMPELKRIATAYSGKAVVDLVYADRRLTISQARSHARSYRLERARLFLDVDGRLATACRATVTPEAAVFDAKGRETYVGRIDDLFIGFGKRRPVATRHDLREALDAVIAHRPAPPALGPPIGCAIETRRPS